MSSIEGQGDLKTRKELIFQGMLKKKKECGTIIILAVILLVILLILWVKFGYKYEVINIRTPTISQ